MKQYALLAFLSPIASLLAVTGPAQSEKLKTKTNPQKQPNVILSMQMIWDMVTSNAMEPKTYKLPM